MADPQTDPPPKTTISPAPGSNPTPLPFPATNPPGTQRNEPTGPGGQPLP